MTLPVPTFFDTDASAVEAEMVAQFEALTGRTLQPAQIERLVISFMAYRESLVRVQGQLAAESQLVELATYPTLDHLGKLVGVTRTPALAATMPVTFTLVGAQPGAIVIPAGTRVAPIGSSVTFATIAQLIIAIGDTTGSVSAAANVTGIAGNGFAAGDLALLDPIASVAGAASTDASAGGADIETDVRLRQRIEAAPASFSVAGPVGAYRFYALSSSPDILDAAVTSPTPGTVRVYLLIAPGGDAAAAIAAATAVLTNEDVRPLSDLVEVVQATELPYTIDVAVTARNAIDVATTMAAATAAAQAFADRLAASLGADVVPSQLIAAIGAIAGVYDVEITEPAALTSVASYEIATCTSVVVTLSGTVDE